MNNQYSALLNYLLNSQGTSTAKNVNDILNGTGLQGTYNTQVAVGNAATQAQQGVANNALNGPVNGYYVNAAPIQDSANQGMIKDSSMPVNLLLGVLQQASALQQNANNNASSIIGSAGQNQVQNRGLSGQESLNGQSYNPDTNSVGFGASTSSGYSPQAVQKLINQGASDLFPAGQTAAQQMETYNEIQKAGGLEKYRMTHTNNLGADKQEIDGTVQALNQIQTVMNQINKSKALRDYLGNGTLQKAASVLNALGGNMGDHALGKLSSDDINALNILNKLNASSDYNTIHGRLDNYLAQRFGNTSLGQIKNAQDNLKILQQANEDLSTGLTSYAKQHGYGSVNNLKTAIYGQSTNAPTSSRYKVVEVK